MPDNENLIYNQHFDYRYIKHVRLIRNKTLEQFQEFMQVDDSVISRLENGQIAFTAHYEAKFNEAMKRLRISAVELNSIGKILEMKRQKGYK